MEFLTAIENILLDHSYCKIPCPCCSKCREIFFNREKLVKIENSDATYERNPLSDKVFEDLKIKNEIVDIKQENFENEKGYNNIDSNQTKLQVKIENSEAIIESEQTYDVISKDWKVKNEEINIEGDDLKKETSTCSGQDEYEGNTLHGSLYSSQALAWFKCDQCDYQTIRKNTLNAHLRVHMNPEEIDRFKCNQCDYQTIQKACIRAHLLQHKNTVEGKMFKCDQCNYRSVYKGNLRRHLLQHKNLEEVAKFKCDQCDYHTIHKCYLKTHLLRHQNPDEVNIFKCDQCAYQTIFKNYLKKHVLRHDSPKEVNILKCYQCDYQSRYRGNLTTHLLRHRNPAELRRFKCDQCPYQTIWKNSIKRHSLNHKKS